MTLWFNRVLKTAKNYLLNSYVDVILVYQWYCFHRIGFHNFVKFDTFHSLHISINFINLASTKLVYIMSISWTTIYCSMNGSPNFFLPKPVVICNYDPFKNKTTSKEHSFQLKSWDYNSGGSSFFVCFFCFFL